MALFKVLRGNKANLNSQPITDGYAWFIKDTGEFFIDVGTSRVQLNAKYATGLKSGATTIEISDVALKSALGAAASKGVVTSIDTSANLPTSNAVKTYADGKIANPSTKSSGQFLKYDGSSWVSSTIDKSTVGLGNVENKSSATIRGEITASNVTTALGYTPLNSNLKGANNGLAELGSDGKVPSNQLPSYVDNVLEYDSQSSFPTTGESGKIYIAKDTNKTYRWSGTAYVEISASLALGTTSSTAYYGDKGKIAYDHSQASHARTDATATAASTTNGNIKINGTETTVYTHPSSHAASMITGLATVATSGSYNDLSNKPTIDNNNQKITGNSTAFGANDTINIVGGGATTVTGDATNKKITISSTNTTYSDMTAATSSAAGTHGLVPAPASGKQDSFLRGNATWADASTILNTLSAGSSTPSDADYYISQYAGGGTTTTTYHRRPMSALWEYIKGKISSVLGLTASSYNGKAATAGTADSATSATTATKLGSTTVGGTTTPIYLNGGTPTALGYTIAKSVPSDAKFTDTVYTHPAGSGASNTSGLYKFSTDSTSHISSVTAVSKSDITGLGIPAQDTTYTFDGTYNASTNKAATVSTVTNAIAGLDGTVSGTPGAGKTLTAFSETDGKVSATFGNISITKSQVSDLGTIGAAAAKGVVSSIDTSANLPTSNAVKTYADGKIAAPSTATAGQVLTFNGSYWDAQDLAGGVDIATVQQIAANTLASAMGYTDEQVLGAIEGSY